MCGIAGVLNRNGRAAERPTLAAMVALMAHRGPDQRGVVTEGPIGLAAARLSIVDASSRGAQPVADGRAALVMNGEIYNYRSLGQRLEDDGAVFRGGSDTEVLFHAISRWGVADTLPLLHGMFAFAFAHLDEHHVTLGRDRLGIKPLVWTETDEGLAWASEARPLGVCRPLDVDPVQALFAVTGRVDRSATATAFAGIRQLPPGHILTSGPDATPHVSQWWDLADDVDESFHHELRAEDAEGLADRLDDLLTTSVRSMSGGDEAPGVLVSGGVDSALIASLAADHDPNGPLLVTADVGGPASEAAAAQLVADHLDRPLTLATFPRNQLLDDLVGATLRLEAPVVTHVNALPFACAARAVHEAGVKAVLTGEGADELFSGYREQVEGRYHQLIEAPRRAGQRAVAHLPETLRRALSRGGGGQGDFLVDLVGRFDGARLESAGAEAFGFLPPPEAARQGQVFTWLGEHLLTLLCRNDAMGMAASVEARFPFLDESLVRFAINLPAPAKVTLSRRVPDRKHPFLRDKALVRRVARRRLPQAIADRPKSGFPMYGHHYLRTTPSFWRGGYVADLLDLPEHAVEHLATGVDPYHAAKLASVEVFGRLFALGWSTAETTAHLQRHARMLP